MRETATQRYVVSGTSYTSHLSGSATSLYVGGGLDIFASPRSGMMLGFDVGHVNGQLTNGHQNYDRFNVGYFFQTKSSLQKRKTS